MNPANFVANHPYWTISIAIVFPNLVSTMPSPNGTGFTSSTPYKWLFGFLHALPNLPRLLSTLFPQLAGTIGIISQDQAAAEISAKALANVAKQADKTVDQAVKTADAVSDAKEVAPKV